MKANHPHLTTQKSFYVETSRARDRAELVTDDAKALREQLEAVTGERISALEAVELEQATGREAGLDGGRSPGRESDASESRERDRAPGPVNRPDRDADSLAGGERTGVEWPQLPAGSMLSAQGLLPGAALALSGDGQ